MRISDWSSDVCSSDLIGRAHNGGQGRFIGEQRRGVGQIARKNEPYEEQSQQGCTQRYGEQLEPPPAPHIPEKGGHATRIPLQLEPQIRLLDRKSTRLNSSH